MDVAIKFVFNGEGQLVPASKGDLYKLTAFQKTLSNGEQVDVYMSTMAHDDGTLSQLAKVHAFIRELASFTGYGFEDMKKDVKRKAGLIVMNEAREEVLKSFSKCSKDELNRAIKACEEIGQFVGCPVS